jgi:hypothetical protein
MEGGPGGRLGCTRKPHLLAGVQAWLGDIEPEGDWWSRSPANGIVIALFSMKLYHIRGSVRDTRHAFHRLHEEIMRIFLLALACMMLFASAPAVAQNCAAIQAACTAQCQASNVDPTRLQACMNRCSITPCQQVPLSTSLCSVTAQGLCNNGFRACTDACVPSTATTAAAIESQTACNTYCCTVLKQCLMGRLCDISTITCE